jgi:glycosyltransferase involved in cell wall biosynthesis
VLFVGFVCVRKGAHLLLDAWQRAGIRGQLVLCGAIEPGIARHSADVLARPDVVHLPYVSDVSSVYRQADIFAFPSLEEGGPLVTYEAMAHGLAVVVSPMGAGAVLRDGIDGMILPAHDTDAWADALRRLAASPDLRSRLGASARARAAEFTWEKVAARRADSLLQRLRSGSSVTT